MVKSKHDGNPKCDFIFDGNINVCLICYRFRDIRHRNVHEIDLDLYNDLRSNLNMPIKSSHATSHLIAKVIFELSVII